jgi:signal transduction histidine kinase
MRSPYATPVDLGRRLLVTGALTMALLGGFFLPFPAHLRDPYLPTLLSFIAFTISLGTVCGHAIFTRTCQSFLQSRALFRTSAVLRRLNAEMAGRIAEQTQDLRSFASQIEATREEERARISRELHDELGQELSALRYALHFTRRRHEQDPSSVRPDLEELDSLVERTARSVREIVVELRPRVEDAAGLVRAIERLAATTRARGGPRLDLNVDAATSAVAAPVVAAVFRVAQEAITNVLRHAGAGRVWMELVIGPEVLRLRVRDDGAGFDPGAARSGVGLLGMEERARAVGGQLTVDSAPGAGTNIELRVPLGEAAGGPS